MLTKTFNIVFAVNLIQYNCNNLQKLNEQKQNEQLTLKPV